MQDQRQWLNTKMDGLFDYKARQKAKGKDLNTSIQSGREFRNPRICEKLIELYNIRQYGSNISRDQFDPDAWDKKPEAFYDSRMYREIDRKRDREKQKLNS